MGTTPQQITQAEAEALLARFVDDEWLAPLTERGDQGGAEFLKAVAAALVRLSQAVIRLDRGAHIIESSFGSRATGVVEFYRTNAAAGAVTVKVGTRVRSTRAGVEFVTTSDAVFGALDLGPVTATVEAQWSGYEWNVDGRRTAADGTNLPGDIDKVTYPVQDPPVGDPTIKVRNIDPTTGGAPGMLDELGRDRGVEPADGEPAEAFRARVRTLPDTVSPLAFVRALGDLLGPLGVTYDMIETYESRYQTCYDAPCDTPAQGSLKMPAAAELADGEVIVISDGITSMTFELDVDAVWGVGNVPVDVAGATTGADVAQAVEVAIRAQALMGTIGLITLYVPGSDTIKLVSKNFGPIGNVAITNTLGSTNFVAAGMEGGATYSPPPTGDPDYDPDLFCYDDPRDPVPFRNRYLSVQDHAAAIIFVLPVLAPIQEHGMALDDPAIEVAEHANPIGRRAHSAYDVPDGMNYDLVLPGAYDGEDIGQQALLLALMRTFNDIRAAAVHVAIDLEGQ